MNASGSSRAGASLADKVPNPKAQKLHFKPYVSDPSCDAKHKIVLYLKSVRSVAQGVSSNYETDLLRPIMDKAAQLAGVSYHTADEKTRTSLKVAAQPCLPGIKGSEGGWLAGSMAVTASLPLGTFDTLNP